MPKIAYVCQRCWDEATEQSCWEDRDKLRVLPTGEQICHECYDAGDWDKPVTDGFLPMWSDLPLPPEYKPVELAP